MILSRGAAPSDSSWRAEAQALSCWVPVNGPNDTGLQVLAGDLASPDGLRSMAARPMVPT